MWKKGVNNLASIPYSQDLTACIRAEESLIRMTRFLSYQEWFDLGIQLISQKITLAEEPATRLKLFNQLNKLFEAST